MKVRYKELRGLLITIIFACLDFVLIMMNLNDGNHARLMLCLGLSFIIVVMFLTQFYVRLMDDCMMVYKGVVVALIPVIIDYADIDEIILNNRIKLTLKVKGKTYHIYSLKVNQIKTFIEEREKNYE